MHLSDKWAWPGCNRRVPTSALQLRKLDCCYVHLILKNVNLELQKWCNIMSKWISSDLYDLESWQATIVAERDKQDKDCEEQGQSMIILLLSRSVVLEMIEFCCLLILLQTKTKHFLTQGNYWNTPVQKKMHCKHCSFRKWLKNARTC